VRRSLATLGVAAVSISMVAACVGSGADNDETTDENPTTLIGEWHQVNKNPDGYMTATIDVGSIQVDLHGRDSRSIFWMGSFEGDHEPAGKFTVTSIPDPDARYTMKHSLMASNESKKTFTYDNGDLSYEFSMAGTSTIVHLTKD
jgi:hypothetical protein